jgi:hypothetical protein
MSVGFVLFSVFENLRFDMQVSSAQRTLNYESDTTPIWMRLGDFLDLNECKMSVVFYCFGCLKNPNKDSSSFMPSFRYYPNSTNG